MCRSECRCGANLSGVLLLRDKEGQRGEGQLGPSVQMAPTVRTAAALAHHSSPAGGLWAVINNHPMATIKAKQQAQWDTVTLREGGQEVRKDISSWACGDRKCLGTPGGIKRDPEFPLPRPRPR